MLCLVVRLVLLLAVGGGWGSETLGVRPRETGLSLPTLTGRVAVRGLPGLPLVVGLPWVRHPERHSS